MSARPLTQLRTLALAFVVLLCLAPSAAARPASRKAPLGGINLEGLYASTSLAQIDSEVAVAHRLHATVIRERMPWSQFEPAGPGRVDRRTEAVAARLMRDAAADHIKVIALLDGTPCWASTAPASLRAACRPLASNHAEAWPPAHAADFGSFAGWVAKRYGSQLVAIEVWNEPDQANEHYLAGPEKPRHYAELLKAAYPAVKRANHRIKVLAGSIVGANGAFMKDLYKQGIKGYYNAVSVHFYTLVLASVRRFREVQLENGDHTPLWLDEFGWSSCWPRYKIEQEQGCVTEATQAQNISNSFKELVKAPYLEAMLTYGFKDTKGEEFGVLSTSGKRKPSFAALAHALASPFGTPSPIRLRLGTRSGEVIASGSAPVGDYMKLEAFHDGRLRYEAIFTLNRFNRYRLKLPKALGTSGLTVKVWQYWLGPSRAAQSSI